MKKIFYYLSIALSTLFLFVNIGFAADKCTPIPGRCIGTQGQNPPATCDATEEDRGNSIEGCQASWQHCCVKKDLVGGSTGVNNKGFGFDSVKDVATQAGYNPGNEPSLDQRISSFIGIFLSLLGVIFMILMIYGGYTWMTAAGDEQKIDKAKDTIRAAVIGLVIVIAAYAISVFVISRLWGAGTVTQ